MRCFIYCILSFAAVTVHAQEALKHVRAHHRAIRSFKVSTDGRYLVSGGEDGKVNLWSFPDLKNIASHDAHTRAVNSVVFSRDNTKILSGSSDETANVWSIGSGEHLLKIGKTSNGSGFTILSDDISIYGVAFSSDDRKIFIGGGNVLAGRSEVKVYDVGDAKLLQTFSPHSVLTLSIDLHPVENWMLSGCASEDGNGAVKMSDTNTGKVLRSFAENLGQVNAVTFSHDAKLAAACADRNLYIWETNSGKLKAMFTGHYDFITSLTFSADDKFIATGSYDKTIKIWSVIDKEVVATIQQEAAVTSLQYSHDGQFLVAGLQNGMLKYFSADVVKQKKEINIKQSNGLDIAERVRMEVQSPFSNLKEAPELVLENGVHNDLVQNIKTTKDGKEIITASWDKTIRIWEASDGRLIRTIRVPQYAGIEGQIYAMDVSPDKKFLVVAGSSVGQKYDKKTEKYIGDYVLLINYATGAILDAATDHKQSIFGVSFSPDGKKVASCSGLLDNKVCIYDLDKTNGKLILTDQFVMTKIASEYFPECESIFGDVCEHAVISVQFTPDSKSLLAIDQHGMLVRYDLKTTSSPSKYTLIGESPNRKNAAITGKITASAAFRSMAVDPQGRFIACGDVKGKVCFFDIKGKSLSPDAKSESAEIQLATLPLLTTSPVMSLDIDATGKFLAVAVGGEVRTFELSFENASRKLAVSAPLKVFSDHKTTTTAVNFSASGASVISAGGDNNACYVWNRESGMLKFRLGGNINTQKITRVGVHKSNPFLLGFGTTLIAGQRVNHFGNIHKAFDFKNLRVIESVEESDYLTAEDQIREKGSSPPDFQTWFDEPMVSWLPLKNGSLVLSTLNALFLNNAVNLLAITGARGYGMANSIDGETFFIGQSDGQIRIYDTETVKLIATLYVADNNEWILFTPDGYYTASRNGAKHVGWLVNQGVRQSPQFYPFEQFDLRLNRPDIVLSRIGGFPKKRIELLQMAYQKRLEKMGVDESALSTSLIAPSIQVDVPLTETTQRMLTLHVSSSDKENTLERLNIYVNDVPLYGAKGLSLRAAASKVLDKQISLELSKGRNKIQVSVLNSAGVESTQETRYVNFRGPVVKPNLYLVAIGVSEYQDASFNLQYAAKDARDVADLYSHQLGKFASVKTLVITDKDATIERIKAAKIFLKEAQPDDEVILFVAGHGLLDDKLDFYFATTDVDFNRPSVRGLKYEELEGVIDQVASRKKLLLIDACHSGEIDKDAVVVLEGGSSTQASTEVKSRGFKNLTNSDLGVTDVFELMRMMFADLRKGSGATVISSASGVEFAFENDVWKNGVFTFSLLEGLKTGKANINSDNEVAVSELRDYVTKRVVELTGGKQHPTSRKENLEFDFPVW